MKNFVKILIYKYNLYEMLQKSDISKEITIKNYNNFIL